MASALWSDCATVWREDDGAFSRSVLVGVRVEDARSESFGAVQPTSSSSGWSLRVFCRNSVDVDEGDYIDVGVSTSSEPSDGCARVTAVNSWTLGGGLHHVEISA